MRYIESYKCNMCDCVWYHEWDTEDYNNDYTMCPNCSDFDFKEVEYE